MYNITVISRRLPEALPVPVAATHSLRSPGFRRAPHDVVPRKKRNPYVELGSARVCILVGCDDILFRNDLTVYTCICKYVYIYIYMRWLPARQNLVEMITEMTRGTSHETIFWMLLLLLLVRGLYPLLSLWL